MTRTPAPHTGPPHTGAPRVWPVLQSLRGWQAAWLAGDLAAGVTLAAIAVPEQMATARLAGLPLASGFYAFIAGSIAIALFGANRWMSVGADSTIAPIIAAGLAGAMAGGAAGGAAHVTTSVAMSGTAPGTAAALGLAGALAVIVGVLLLLARLLRLAWLADLLSVPVTTGFLAGIAVRIVAGQLPDLFGLPKPAGGVVRQIAGTLGALGGTNWASFTLGAAVFAVVIGLARVNHKIPGALIAVVGASLAVPLLHLERRGVELVGPVSAGLPRLGVPHVGLGQAASLAQLGAVIAVVCIMQTSAVARSFPSDGGDDVGRDVLAVGAGSILAGLFGAFAVDASPPRTALVQSAGGRSQVASLVAVAVILGLLLFASGLIARVPHAALAGILVYVATHIFRLGEMRRIYRESQVEFLLLAVTALAIVVLPIANAITLGVVLSLAYGVSRVSRPAAGPLVREPGTTVWWSAAPGHDRADEPGVLVFGFAGPLIFTSAQYFRRRFEATLAARTNEQPAPRLVVFEASGVVDLDYTGAAALLGEVAALKRRGLTVALARLESPRAERAAARLGVLDAVGRDHVFLSVAEAVTALGPGGR